MGVAPSSPETARPEADDVAKRQFERLVFFSDAVFAIAITLLVLDLKPMVGRGGAPSLVASGPKILSFVIGFYVIARYWLAHHALFGDLRREDQKLRLANLCFLAGIVFLPFPTSILTEYRATAQSVMLFAATAGTVGLLFAVLAGLSVRVAIRRDGNMSSIANVLLGVSGAPLVFAASIPIALWSHRLAMVSWLMITPVQLLLTRASRHTAHKLHSSNAVGSEPK